MGGPSYMSQRNALSNQCCGEDVKGFEAAGARGSTLDPNTIDTMYDWAGT